ncbi:MAG: nucleotidyltransferase domain-containing protein [Candidatus Hodarchaeales archaeon]|jgi:predicted nucleotidyltransferase
MQKIQDKLDLLVERVRRKWKIHGVILTGSYAKQNETPFSDIDVVIIGDFEEDFLDRGLLVMELTPEIPKLEPLCYTREEFQRMFQEGRVTILDCLSDGIILYGEGFLRSYQKAFKQALKDGLTRTSISWVLPPSMNP